MEERIIKIETEQKQINYSVYVSYLGGSWNICKRAHLGWDDSIDCRLWKEVISKENSDIPALLVSLLDEIKAIEPKGASYIRISGLRNTELSEPNLHLINRMIKECALNSGFKNISICR